MAEPDDMIVPLLREMRAETKERFDQIDARFDQVDRSIAAMEAAQVSFRHALAGDSLMGRLVTGDFEQRIEALDRTVRELEISR